MVLCIVAFVIFAVMAIFSAAYRPLAAEAFECVFRKLTFRKCRTALDERIRSQISGKILRYSPKTAAFTFKHFEILSWIFVIITLLSFGYSAYSTYNYVQYGNCYGPEDTGQFCIFNALTSEHLTKLQQAVKGEIILPDADDDPFIGPEDAKVTIIEFGCYSCPYTREARLIVNTLLDQYKNKIRYVYRDFPIQQKHGDAFFHSEVANCALDQDKFWEVHNLLFTEQHACIEEASQEIHIDTIIEKTKLNTNQFDACLESRKYTAEIEKDFEDGLKAGVTGTPTFFINGRRIEGPKPIKAFQTLIDEELEKYEY